MANSATYNREYYQKNRDRIASRKKDRYEKDPNYRAAILTRRNKQRDQEKEERNSPDRVPKAVKPPRLMKVTVNGVDRTVSMYTLGQLSYKLNLQPQTIRKWEIQGIIPPPTYRSRGRHRLYTEFEVDIILKVYTKYKSENEHWSIKDEFIAELHSSLMALKGGIPSLM